MKLNTVLKQITKISLAVAVATPAMFGMIKKEDEKPSNASSNQNLKIEGNGKEKENGKNENLKLDFGLNLDKKGIEGGSKILDLTQMQFTDNDFKELVELQSKGKIDNVLRLLGIMLRNGLTQEEIDEGINRVGGKIELKQKKTFTNYCQKGFGDFKIFFHSDYYKNDGKKKAFDSQLEGYGLFVVESGSNGKIPLCSPKWLVFKLKSELGKKIFRGLGNCDFFMGFSVIRVDSGVFNLSNDAQNSFDIGGSSLIIFVSPEQKIKSFVNEFYVQADKKISIEKREERGGKMVSMVEPFKKDLSLCFPKGSQGFPQLLDLELLDRDDESNYGEKDYYQEHCGSLFVELDGNGMEYTRAMIVKIPFNGNIMSSALQFVDFVKGFKFVKKICFSGSYVINAVVLNNLSAFQNVNHFEMIFGGSFRNLLMHLNSIDGVKQFLKISMTCNLKRAKNHIESCSEDYALRHPIGSLDLNELLTPSDEENLLKAFCRKNSSIISFNLTGWRIPAKDVIEIVKLLPNLKRFAIGVNGYSQSGVGRGEKILQYSEQDVKDIKNTLPEGCKLIVVSLIPGGEIEELNADLFDKENMVIKE
jgi:hypothetical protein